MSDGSIGSPWELSEALTTWRIKPGHTVYLRSGVHSGQFVSSLIGTEAQPITIRPYPGEIAIIDGMLDINGAYTVWRDLEFRYSGWVTRTSAQTGGTPTDIPRRDLNIYGPGTKMINCVIHDLSNFGWWGPAVGSDVYGCLMYSNGWDAPDRGHGHGMYTQNHPGGRKVWQNCITWGHYSTCGKVYSATNAPLRQYDISGLICGPSGDSRLIIGSDDGSTEDVTVSDCMTWGAGINFSDALVTSQIAFDHLYVAFDEDIPMVLGNWNSLAGFDNTFIGGDGADESYRVVGLVASPGAWTLDRNAYHYTGPNAEPFREDGVSDYTLAGWQAATGFDLSSTLVVGPPTVNRIIVQPNAYDPARSHVVIYNWEGLASVPAPLSGRYTNAMNVAEGIDLEAGAALPMASWTVATPIGAAAPLVNWDSRFAVFLVTQ